MTNATGLPLSTGITGTLAHENGGLEADVSAYSGLVKIAAGATSAVATSEGGNGAADSGKVPTFDASGHLSMRNGYHVNGTDELVINPNGQIYYIDNSGTPVSATLNLSNAQGQELTISDAGGEIVVLTGAQTLEDKTLAAPVITGAVAFPDNTRQTFNPGATAAGLNVGSQAGEPSSLVNGDLWYDSTANAMKARINSATVSLGAGGGSGTTEYFYRLTADQNFTTTSFVDATNMEFPVAANTTYRFTFFCRVVSSTAAEAPLLAVDGPASPTMLSMDSRWAYSATAEVAGSITAYDTATTNTTGTTTESNYILSGYFTNGANAGTFKLRGRTELGGANSVYLKAGSYYSYAALTDDP